MLGVTAVFDNEAQEESI